jgi:radical SAM superfamily enzyme YgiQ (UPF0313 family)
VKLLLLYPAIGRSDPESYEYVRTWQMVPLTMATVAAIIRRSLAGDVELAFHDQRMTPVIPFERYADYDAVLMTCETFTARTVYQLAARFATLGLKVVLGGYHPTLVPRESEQYADAIVVGNFEPVAHELLSDLKQGQLKRRYQGVMTPAHFTLPDRSIYAGVTTKVRGLFGERSRGYVNLNLVETDRGCPHQCSFCSIAAATKSSYLVRPLELILEDLSTLPNNNVFLVSDNLLGEPRRLRELCEGMKGMGLNWISQGTLTLAHPHNRPLLKLMADSGCLGILIGFESIRPTILKAMNKGFNAAMGDYKALVSVIHSYGIGIYGTFIHGFGDDTPQDIRAVSDFAVELGLIIAAFNHLMPFPGTPDFARMQAAGQLDARQERWWLDPDYRFGEAPFAPQAMSSSALHEATLEARRRFYSFPSAVKRLLTNPKGNLFARGRFSPVKAAAYAALNFGGALSIGREITQKDGRPLGLAPTPVAPRVSS